MSHVVLNALQHELVGRHVQRFVGRAIVEISLVDHAGHDDGMAHGDLVEVGVSEPGEVGGGQPVRKSTALLPLVRNANPVRLDFAIGQFEPAMTLA